MRELMLSRNQSNLLRDQASQTGLTSNRTNARRVAPTTVQEVTPCNAKFAETSRANEAESFVTVPLPSIQVTQKVNGRHRMTRFVPRTILTGLSQTQM